MPESLTKTVGKGTAWVSSFSLATKVVGLGSTLLVLSSLSVFEFGLLKLVLSLVPLLGLLKLPGVDSVITADMGVEMGKDNKGEMRYLFQSLFTLSFFLSIVAWAILFFGAEIAASLYDESIASFVRIASFMFLASPFRSVFQVLFAVYFKFFQRSLYTFIEEATKFLIVAYLVLFSNLTLASVLYATVIAHFIPIFSLSFVFWKLFSDFKNAHISNRRPFWDILREHGKWSIISSYINDFSTNVRLWIIKFFLGTEVVGLFSAAVGFVNHINGLVPLGGVLKPIIPQYLHQKERFFRLINKGIKYQLVAMVALGTAGFFAGPYVIEFFFPQYVAAIPLFQILLLILIPKSFNPIGAAYFALKEQKVLSYLTLGKAVLSAALLLVLLPIIGIWGVAVEPVIAHSIFMYATVVVLKRKLKGFRISLRYLMTFDQYDKLILKRSLAFIRRR